MNILMVYQSVVDMCASVFMLLINIIKVDGTGLSRESAYDQFVCLMWVGGQPLYLLITESTYGILITALDRYIAVLYPIWYKNNVRTASVISIIPMHLLRRVTSKGQVYRPLKSLMLFIQSPDQDV